jgi:hypothetical protein
MTLWPPNRRMVSVFSARLAVDVQDKFCADRCQPRHTIPIDATARIVR